MKKVLSFGIGDKTSTDTLYEHMHFVEQYFKEIPMEFANDEPESDCRECVKPMKLTIIIE